MKYITVRILRWCVRVCELQLSATECFCHFNVYFHKTQNPRNHFTSHPAFVSLRNGSIQNVSNVHSHKPIRSLVRTQRHKPCTHSLSKYIIWLIIMHALRLIIIRSSGFFSLFLSLFNLVPFVPGACDLLVFVAYVYGVLIFAESCIATDSPPKWWNGSGAVAAAIVAVACRSLDHASNAVNVLLAVILHAHMKWILTKMNVVYCMMMMVWCGFGLRSTL